MFVLLLVLSLLVQGSVAPFPKGHPYNRYNTEIDAVWSNLDEDTQKSVYNTFTRYEPLANAHQRYKDQADLSQKTAHNVLDLAKKALSEQAHELKQALKGEEPRPAVYWPVNEDYPEQLGEARWTSEAQDAWENLQVGVQHSVHQSFKKKRAKYQTVLELLRLINKKKRSFVKAEVNFIDNIKHNIEDIKYKIVKAKDDFKNSIERRKEDFKEFVKSKKDLLKKVLKKESDHFGYPAGETRQYKVTVDHHHGGYPDADHHGGYYSAGHGYPEAAHGYPEAAHGYPETDHGYPEADLHHGYSDETALHPSAADHGLDLIYKHI